MRRVCNVLIVVTIIFGLFMFLGNLLACMPPPFPWHIGMDRCVDRSVVQYMVRSYIGILSK